MNLLASPARFDHAELLAWTIGVLDHEGVAGDAAHTAANVLVRTSLRGIDTHGLSRLPAYVEKLMSGEVNARPAIGLETRDGMMHCHGDGGLGQVVIPFALERTMHAARTSALVACRIDSTGHLGALGTLVLPAAEQGFLAILCQRTPPIMALPGSIGPAIGNNPIAFACPLAGHPPLVFDMAHSVVARGHVMQASREGRGAIPGDWALGPDGAPTSDPALAMQGAMQPIAGHKGMGLAMLVECLAGSLNGVMPPEGSPGGQGKGSASNASAFLVVINPALAIGEQAFNQSVSAWLHTFLKASGPNARYPGQRQGASEELRRREGIPVPDGLLAELQATGRLARHPFDLAKMQAG
ncbi:Ldh family oxidoreductase [Variovorax sp. J22R133]|uniref:Ldh family oxidoreductase n=1 Tax=Variovorax brevis TaxID=3053503 RepID=UPI0025751F53|nr:Ldh family oxidoreductase [Variovorax sp. J22R133]MDM0113740.1 Ldh family oxidoreductase [Variovorax sp. J22R133]